MSLPLILDVLLSARFDSLAYFSSIGPTADGRLKPDITAPGTTVSATPQWVSTAVEPFSDLEISLC